MADLQKSNNRIKDYTRLCVLGILFIEQWIQGTNKDTKEFNKLTKGFNILK